MRKLLLNPTPLFRKLRQLFLLLTLLLVPQLAGAADYLTIAGIQVTDANASNITGTGITAGTVTFDPSNNTLTLDNARVNGTVSTTLETLNVHLKGHSIFNVTTDGTNNFYLFNGATNLYYSAENFGDVLEGIGTTDDYKLWVSNVTESYDGSVVFWKNSYTKINNKCYCKLSKPYLFVGDNEEVDKSNYNSDTRFSFDAANSSLTFSATPNSSNNNAFLVKSNIANLTVNITDNIIYELDNSTNTGKAFIYTGNDNSSTLTLNIAEGKTLKVQWSNTSTDNHTDWINQGFSNTNISYNLSTMGSSDVYGEEVLASLLYSIIFSNVGEYGLTIAGIPVTNANKDNVFAGDQVNDGKVSFTPASTGNNNVNTLTLNGATLTGPIITGLSSLTIDIKGANTITTNTTCIQKMANTNPSLTFKSTSAEVGSLIIKNTGNTGTDGVSKIGATVSKELAPILPRSGAVGGYTSYMYYFTDGSTSEASFVPSYGVIVNDLCVYEGNAANVFGDNTVSFDKATSTLTLNNASGISNIKTYLGTLNIDLIGNNSLYLASNGSIFESADGNAVTINVGSSSTTKGFLTIGTDGTNSNAHFKDANVTLTPIAPLAILSGNLATNQGTLEIGEIYDITVGGVTVNAKNASNIFPGTQGGTPSASFENNTLTLTSLYLGTDANHYSGNAIETGLDNLSIKINNVSSIYCDGYAFKGINGTEKITFLTEGPAGSELNLFGTQGFNNISEKIFQNNYGYVPTSSTTYQIKYLQAPTMSSSGNNVTLAKSDSACYQSCNIVYSIEYSDGTSTSGTYSAPFEMTKPGTLTAYLTPGEGYGNSGNAVGKLFGMSAETYAIAVNEEITPTVVPAIEGTDGITYSFTSSSSAGPIEIDDHKITGREISVNNVEATFTQSTPVQTYVLNSSAVLFTVKVGDNIGSKFVGTNEYATYYEASNNFTLPTGMEAYIVTGVSDNQVVLKSLSVLPKLTPLLLYKGTATNFTSVITDETDNNTSGNKLKYAEADYTTTGNEFVLFKDEFVKATETIPSGKCYLQITTNLPARGILGIGDDGSTAIEGIDVEATEDETWYDLQGRRIDKPTRPGLYIKNGKKVVVNNK